eukprot:TRINITY_DN5449_c0_g1_i1.p1 TRINITY_DN5449_c0_g1~~TRINITY_DN5449_c0_g1_i1.p1  ORF type:complete len:467 (+),score=107.22 TRINITY_DN5449_c0_g1_i1:151-1551(+)
MEGIIQAAFSDADVNGDGVMDKEEFAKLMKILNPDLWDEAKTEELFKAADQDNSGTLNIQETLSWILQGPKPTQSVKAHPVAAPSPQDAIMDEIRSVDADGNGELDRAEFQKLMISLNPDKWKGKKLGKLFKAADKDNDGSLSSTEVVKWILDGSDTEKQKRQKLNEEDENLYTLLTIRDGVSGVLRLDDLLDRFRACKNIGLGPKLPQLVPQESDSSREPEDISPLELGHLFQLIQENPQVSPEEARSTISHIKSSLCQLDEQDLEAAGLNARAVVNLRSFKQLLDLLSSIMGIDRSHLRAYFTWAQTNCFDMPDGMTTAVLMNLFGKTPKCDAGILQQSVNANDFNGLIYDLGLIDRTGKKGIQQGKIALLFQESTQKMPERLEEQKNKLSVELSRKNNEKKPQTKNKGAAPKDKGAGTKDRVVGRHELSLLMQSFFMALPMPREYNSTADMILGFLETIAAKA